MAVLRFGAVDPPRPITAGTLVSVSVVAAVTGVGAVVADELHGYTDSATTVVMTIG